MVVVQYPNRAEARRNRTAARLRLKEEERVFRAIHGMEKGPYLQRMKDYGRVIVVTTAKWYREEVDRLEAEGGSAFVWMRHWPHYGAGVINGVVGNEFSSFTTQDD